MNKETKQFIKDWITKADEDLLVINRLTEGSIIATSAICFHCQQLVEKILKAYLIINGKEIKKTHNIEFLLSECADFDNEFNEIDPQNLSDFGVEVRYPGDMYQPTENEALEYKQIAIEIKDFVTEKIEKLMNE
ncbi:MAG: HEPN domain-containing protein [Bacteroidales bacterium]|nr:HEPN domain-containing protein [Bacteroidales bacterium]